MKKPDKGRGRPADPSKMAVYCRIDRGAVEELDHIAEGMEPKPTRAALIDLAVREYVERNAKKRTKG